MHGWCNQTFSIFFCLINSTHSRNKICPDYHVSGSQLILFTTFFSRWKFARREDGGFLGADFSRRSRMGVGAPCGHFFFRTSLSSLLIRRGIAYSSSKKAQSALRTWLRYTSTSPVNMVRHIRIISTFPVVGLT